MTNMKKVHSIGLDTATIAIVGESPGKYDAIRDIPFVGSSGQLLDNLLSAAGIPRYRCKLLNVVRYAPEYNDFGVFWDGEFPQPILITEAQELYNKLASMPNLKVIITLGKYALWALTGEKEIIKWRGSIMQSKYFPTPALIIPTFRIAQDKQRNTFSAHTQASVFTSNGLSPIVILDMQKAKRVAQGWTTLPEYDDNVYPTRVEIENYLHLPSDIPVSLDIECGKGQITRVGITDYIGYSMSIPFINMETGQTIHENTWVIEHLRNFCSTHPIIGQNINFDAFWLWKKWGVRLNILWDTMIAQHILLPGLPKFIKPLSLSFMTSIYTDHSFYKDEGKVKDGKVKDDRQYGLYNCKDVRYTLEIYQEQKALLEAQPELLELFNFEMALSNGPVQYMSYNGVKVNVHIQELLRTRAEKELEYLSLKVAETYGNYINLASPKQVKELIHDIGGSYTKTVKSTDEDRLKILRARLSDKPSMSHLSDILDLILTHRTIEQLRKNILSMRVDSDGRARCSYNLTTDTGRFSSSANPFGSGTNLQNIPRRQKIRQLFEPDPGYVMIKTDLSQAELRIVAYLSKCQKLIYELNNSADIHTQMASAILSIPIDQVTKKKRNLAKSIVHGTNYGEGVRTIVATVRKSLGLNLTEAKARETQSNYFRSYQQIKLWHKEIERTILNGHKLITPFGRERIFPGRVDTQLLHKAYAYIPQSVIGDTLNKIMLKWFNEHTVGMLLMQVHDEIVTQCLPEDIEKHKEELDKAFDFRSLYIHGEQVLIPWDMDIVKNYSGELINE